MNPATEAIWNTYFEGVSMYDIAPWLKADDIQTLADIMRIIVLGDISEEELTDIQWAAMAATRASIDNQ